MKTKKIVFVLLCAVICLFTGCGKELVCKNGVAVINKSNVKLTFPETWAVTEGDDIYGEMYNEMSDEYGSAEELKNAYENNGERLLLKICSPDGGMFALLSEINKGETTPRELLEAVRVSSEDGLQAAGYSTDSKIEDTDWGGISGVMSSIKVYEDKDKALLEEREFCFERGELIYSLKMHIYGGYENEADEIKLSVNK